MINRCQLCNKKVKEVGRLNKVSFGRSLNLRLCKSCREKNKINNHFDKRNR